jgi:hypothetical protein
MVNSSVQNEGFHISPTTSVLNGKNTWDHFQARWGIRRGHHRVTPGLYALGHPQPSSPVFVTANYTLSFDALRSALGKTDAYILVLDTQGINVWCAAGKGTFGTAELIHRIAVTHLKAVVTTRILILPQLGAPGVAAHEVKKNTGFRVEYGPIRAEDLPDYLKTHQASPAMRSAIFNLKDRLVLIPIELVHVLIPLLIAGIAEYFLGGLLPTLATILSIIAGVAIFPILLPWLPTKDFSSKGWILGMLVTLPFTIAMLLRLPPNGWWLHAGTALALQLALPVVTAFIALNFTGSTPFTSRSGVKSEIYAYIPWMAGLFGGGVLLTIGAFLVQTIGRI